jgi:hypothetical protein
MILHQVQTIRGTNAGTSTSSGYPAVDQPKHQPRRFFAGQHPSDLFRRDRRHQFGTQFEPLTEGNTGRAKRLSTAVRRA